MEKDKPSPPNNPASEPPAALEDSLLDTVLARRPPGEKPPRKPSQPANTFISRTGEIASDLSRHPYLFKPPARRDKPGHG